MQKQPPQGLEYSYYKISDLISTFGMYHTEGLTVPLDYGTGEKYTLLESHTVTLIDSRPGITVTEIAACLGRTKSSISQLISRMAAKGLVDKTQHPGEDKKLRRLYLTDKGQALSDAHVRYDEAVIGRYLEKMLEHFSVSELNTVYRYLDMSVRLDPEE